MFNYKQIIITLIVLLANLAYASDISYDQQNITPQTWEEVDLTYTNTINGKAYTEQANLLRPISWIKQRHLDKIGNTVHLTEGEVGGDIDAKVLAIKPSKLNYANNVSGNDKPVISTFIKHSDDVWNYTFKDQQGSTETIEATSNHPFYSLDQQDYIPIGQIRIGEHLKAKNGSETVLFSRLKHNKGIETVYNLEVYQAHNYQVGSDNLLVHNDCGCLGGLCQRIKRWWRGEATPPSTSTIAQEVPNTGNINSGFTPEAELEPQVRRPDRITPTNSVVSGIRNSYNSTDIAAPQSVIDKNLKNRIYVIGHGSKKNLTITGNFSDYGIPLAPGKAMTTVPVNQVIKMVQQRIEPGTQCIVLGVCFGATSGVMEEFANAFPGITIAGTVGKFKPYYTQLPKGRKIMDFERSSNAWELKRINRVE